MNKQAFAVCMKRNREKQNISLETLVEKTGISIDKLIEFESGEFEQIKASELKKIGNAISVPNAILMKGGGLAQSLHRSENENSYCEWDEY